ncbi:TPA: hypothetical protein KDY96_004011 [Vibrio parahaemolyticus]|nr:hypothetical protein [Vibrio parahaemolyticus]
MKNQHVALSALMAWLQDNIDGESPLHFDNAGQINSEMVYQALAMQLSTLPPCEALKQHLALSHSLLAQVVHLQRVHRPDERWQPQFIRLIEQKTQQGVFVSPSINPEPYREFHYYNDEHNTLWALLVMDSEDRIIDVYLHPELYADPEMFALCLFHSPLNGEGA